MKKKEYINKISKMISDGIIDGTYVEREDTIMSDLKHFQTFIRDHFKDHPKYKKMMPDTHQSARLYGTGKTHAKYLRANSRTLI